MVVEHEFRGMLKKNGRVLLSWCVCVFVPTGTEEYHEIPDFSFSPVRNFKTGSFKYASGILPK